MKFWGWELGDGDRNNFVNGMWGPHPHVIRASWRERSIFLRKEVEIVDGGTHMGEASQNYKLKGHSSCWDLLSTYLFLCCSSCLARSQVLLSTKPSKGRAQPSFGGLRVPPQGGNPLLCGWGDLWSWCSIQQVSFSQFVLKGECSWEIVSLISAGFRGCLVGRNLI